MDDTEDTGRDDGEKGGRKSSGGGGGGGGGIRIPPNKLKEVMEVWKDLDAVQVIAYLAEFFSEYPNRASANVEVSWTSANLQKKGFAIINNFLDVGQDLRDFMQDPARKAGADRLRKKLGFVPTGIVPGVSG